MTSPGPLGLTRQTAERTDGPTDLRTGVVSAVTARGIAVAIAGGSVSAAHLDSYAPAVGDTVALVKTQDSWLAMGRVVGSGTPTDYSTPGSAAGPSLLDGILTVGTSTLASSTGSSVTVPKYSLTYYHPPNHQVLVLAFFGWSGTVANDWILVDLVETTTGLGVTEWTEQNPSATFGRDATISGVAKQSLGGAKRTIAMTMSRLSGTGTMSIAQNDARPGYMIALDMGDATVFRTV